MFNEFLWLAFAVFDLSMTVIIYRYFGKNGLYALIPFNLILCNIQVMKIVTLFGFTTTLGNILYTSVFLTTNILSEFHGKKAAKKGILLGFSVLILSTIYMQIALMYNPAPDDFIQEHLVSLFSFFPRLVLASLVAYLCSQLHDLWLYNLCRKLTKQRFLWLRNIVATLSSQLLDSIIFCFIAFWGVFENDILWQILFTTFLFKAFISCLDTPFLYLARFAHGLRVKRSPEEKNCS